MTATASWASTERAAYRHTRLKRLQSRTDGEGNRKNAVASNASAGSLPLGSINLLPDARITEAVSGRNTPARRINATASGRGAAGVVAARSVVRLTVENNAMRNRQAVARTARRASPAPGRPWHRPQRTLQRRRPATRSAALQPASGPAATSTLQPERAKNVAKKPGDSRDYEQSMPGVAHATTGGTIAPASQQDTAGQGKPTRRQVIRWDTPGNRLRPSRLQSGCDTSSGNTARGKAPVATRTVAEMMAADDPASAETTKLRARS